MKMGCPKCTPKWKETEHEKVDADPPGHHQDIGYSCRGVRSDYRRMRCTECGHTQDWDFARD